MEPARVLRQSFGQREKRGVYMERKRQLKRTGAALLAGILVCGFTACANSDDKQPTEPEAFATGGEAAEGGLAQEDTEQIGGFVNMPESTGLLLAEQNPENALKDMIEEDELDLSGLGQDQIKQLEIFSKAADDWLIKDLGPWVLLCAVYDLDGDGKLELITEVTQGTGLFSENHFYQADTVNGGIIELPQNYYAKNSEFELMSGFDRQAYRDGRGIIYYLTSDVTKNGYAEMYRSEGAFYLADGCISNIQIRGSHVTLKEDGSTEEIYYDTQNNEITKEEWERLLHDFTLDKEPVSYYINWRDLREEEVEAASEQGILRELTESYMEGMGKAKG